TRQSQEHNVLKNMKKQVQASSTTIAEDTTEDITKNTTKNMSKRQEMLAQTKLKEELIQLNQELSQLQNLEDKKLQQVEDQLKAASINMQLIKPVGRLHLEEVQPNLLKTILHLVSSDGQANE
ncbi:27457_t:CDS:2, partial [Gigaspora margarita]